MFKVVCTTGALAFLLLPVLAGRACAFPADPVLSSNGSLDGRVCFELGDGLVFVSSAGVAVCARSRRILGFRFVACGGLDACCDSSSSSSSSSFAGVATVFVSTRAK
jgi:hypothetical protein